MQVVINRNSGGFALSDAALLEVYRLNPASRAIKVVRPDEAFQDSFFDEMFFVKTDDGNYVQAASDTAIARACPTLVSVVRRLKSEASAKSAQLDVIDMPDTLSVYANMSDEILMARRIRAYA